ncbi:MAG TPA: c-type cytochrome [Guyparkeria sp.]|nr:c-type cytochrome [Guyparkeria sp.]
MKPRIIQHLAAPALIASLFGLAAAPASASSHNAAEVAKWTVAEWHDTMQSMPEGDAEQGKKLHDQTFCASCHGDHGESLSGNWPRLAGQRAEYTYKQLIDYADGRRSEDNRSQLMIVVSEDLSEQDMADLAAFYEQQGLPETAKPAKSHPAHQLISVGDPARLITPCSACHGSNGSGGINESSTLRGQPEVYFIRTMKLFRDGYRDNDVAHGMSQFAKPLTDAEIAALADYYAAE